MKIKDPAHAARVLEHLVKRLEPWDDFEPLEGWACVLEGAKAVLKQRTALMMWDSTDPLGTPKTIARANGRQRGREEMIVSLAQAYAPRMEDADMEVPE